ncbi:MAG TPA: D-alanyl-D-alanine carboxypeptidase/D-alanyl-D-alanine-endopeptidase [Gemmatimonadaceae bacterium]|nr:D-alanyl-D-alanine carboxypeptidase/D-alanyl-D-alanine-endopeptidase [Gemmatimonadaceae bacterium]
MTKHSRRLALLLAIPLFAACQRTPETAPAPRQRDAGPAAERAAGGRASNAARAYFTALADSLLGDPMFRSSHWGVLVVDPATGDTIYSRNAGKLFMPASNQKLITGASALALLGPDYRFTTRVMGAGIARDGTLAGDLVIVGTGDPSFSDSLANGDAMAPLRELADSLAARGVRTVAGRLIRGADAFPDSTLGFGWAWDDLDYGYSAPIDELVFNEGFARITIYGGARPGDRVRVATHPASTVPALGAVDVTTTGCCAERQRVEWMGDVRGVRPTVSLRGQVRARDSVRVNVALRHPASAWLDAFTEALTARGIKVLGGVEPNAMVDTAGLHVLASRQSPPLRDILPVFEKPSQNQIGEILFRTLGREVTGTGTADSGRAVVERQLVAWGADSAGFAVRDGSGLSRHDYVTPETIIRVLDAMRRHESFRVFYDALPLAGVDGTIAERMRGGPAERNVRAKTGTIDKARSLSGYVTDPDGRLLLFSMLSNNHVVSNREVERVQDALATALAGLRIVAAEEPY